MGWSELAIAFAAFFLSHSLPVRPPLRPWLQARLGARGFTIAYSVVSLALLAWLVIAAGRAPHVLLWAPAPWQSYAAMGVVLIACLVVSLSIGRPNPFSFGGAQNAQFDPAQPGLLRLTRHPLLAALGLWAGAHLLPNGDLAHVILFGTFAAFALLGMRLIDRRHKRAMGPHWQALWGAVAARPLREALRLGPWGVARLAAGLALYLVLLALHPTVIGVAPVPW